MILLPEQKTIIITPPKTASTTLHKALCTEEYGGIWVSGLSMNGRGVDHHVLAKAPGYKTLVTVRHPLDRLVSLYLHLARFDAGEGRATMAFWCFANMVGRGEQPDPFYGWNMTRHLDGLEDFTPIHVENLDMELRAAGVELPTPLPRLNATPVRRPWPEYYGEGAQRESLLAVLEGWAGQDCERWGYEGPAGPRAATSATSSPQPGPCAGRRGKLL